MNAIPTTLAQEANNEILRSRYHRAIGNLIVAETALERQQENCLWLKNEIQAIALFKTRRTRPVLSQLVNIYAYNIEFLIFKP